MAAYKCGGLVPTAPNDPDDYFFEEGNKENGHSNCYGYAVNYHGHINPGGRCGTKEIHGNMARSDITVFDSYCIADGVNPIGATIPPAYVGKGGGWVAALFTNGGDMHWSRLDSGGNWSDKMPGDMPERSTFRNNVQPHQVLGLRDWNSTLVFAGYYWVDAVPSKKKAKSSCVIL